MTRATLNKVNNKRDQVQAYFTPPWAARQYCWQMEQLGYDLHQTAAFDPCAGMGHMLHGLADSYAAVFGNDLIDYKPRHFQPTCRDYLAKPERFDGHVVTNPPFNKFNQFVPTAIWAGASVVAMLVRLPALAGVERANALYRQLVPTYVFIQTARPHMEPGVPPATRGRSAMDFCWIVWDVAVSLKAEQGSTRTVFLPGDKEEFTRDGDFFDTGGFTKSV